MDDARTQRTLDHLADLYLTSPDGSPARRNAAALQSQPGRAPLAGQAQQSNQPHQSNQVNQSNQSNQSHEDHVGAADVQGDDPQWSQGMHVSPLRLPPKLRGDYSAQQRPATPLHTTPAPAVQADPHSQQHGHALSSQQDQISQDQIQQDQARQGQARIAPAQRGQDEAGQDQQRQTQQTRASSSSSSSSSPSSSSPSSSVISGPWAEVRQQRRQSFQMAEYEQQMHVNDVHGGARHGAHDEARGGADDDVQGDMDEGVDDGSRQDEPPRVYMFPQDRSRSMNLAATGVMADQGEAQPVAGARTYTTQAVFLGNLPGFAGPWLAQYAQLLAVDRQGVAIIHVTGQELHLEVVWPAGVKPPAVRQDGTDLVELLERLSQDDACPVTRWLVHLPLPVSARQLEMARDFDAWTLLTGSDDAAVAAGVQWLRRLVDQDRRLLYRRAGVAVMGSEPAAAPEVVRRISQGIGQMQTQGDAAALSLASRPGRKQIAPVNIVQAGVFSPTDELWTELVAYLGSDEAEAVETVAGGETRLSPGGRFVREAEAAAVSVPYTHITDTTNPPVHDSAAATAALGQPTADVPDHHEAIRSEPAGATAAGVRQADQPMTATAGVTAGAAAAVAAAVPDAPYSPEAPSSGVVSGAASGVASGGAGRREGGLDLVRWLPAGAVALEARCPHQPRVQLAVDAKGCVHLLAQTGQSLREATMDLLEASQWVRAHLPLLGLSCQGRSFDVAAQPVAHLFTDQSIAAAAMAHRLGDMVKLHLLLQATVGHETTWVAAPLN